MKAWGAISSSKRSSSIKGGSSKRTSSKHSSNHVNVSRLAAPSAAASVLRDPQGARAQRALFPLEGGPPEGGPPPECAVHAAGSSSPDKEYIADVLQRLRFVMNHLWPWKAPRTHNWGKELDGQAFTREAAIQAMREGFIPYIMTHFASTCGREQSLRHLDMSYPGRANIPFLGFEPSHREVLGSGIGHSFMYYSVFPGSTFPMHCEQGGLGAFNAVVGALTEFVSRAMGGGEGGPEEPPATAPVAGSQKEKQSPVCDKNNMKDR